MKPLEICMPHLDPSLHPKLKSLIVVAKDLHQLLSQEKGLTITDCERQLLYLPGKRGKLSIEEGDLLLPESVSRQSMRENRVVTRKMERCLGWDYIGRAVPIKDDAGRVIGSVGTVEIIENRAVSESIIMGHSPCFHAACEQAKKAARYGVSVLILGETGTGKEVMARYIVAESYRRDKPFLTINCASIPPSLFESEMFGYESGSFTGASKRGRRGYFEIADHGTIFLDEVGELEMSLQAKLLRVLEMGKIIRVGGNREIEVDTRIIAATNRDLKEYVKEGRFRADLFFRLSSVIITIPSLHCRKEDLSLYIDKFLHQEGHALNKEDVRITPQAMEMLMAYEYPGNIRELQNIIKRALILCDSGIIEPEHIGMQMMTDMPATSGVIPPCKAVSPIAAHSLAGLDFLTAEKRALQNALAASSNKSKAAKALGISRDTLYRKMKKHGLF
jgi:transcriptional regulator with PAS, ATPase and Fis domain